MKANYFEVIFNLDVYIYIPIAFTSRQGQCLLVYETCYFFIIARVVKFPRVFYV